MKKENVALKEVSRDLIISKEDFEKYFRLFNKEQFDILSKNWKIIVLNEDIITRVNKKKVLWEFIFQKI